MGQIAEDMVDGTTCDSCGCYFKSEVDGKLYTHGYPATCWDCWDNMDKEEKREHQKAEVKTL